METVHSSAQTYFLVNPSFQLAEASFFCKLETVLLYSEFFLLVKTIIKTWGKSIFKDKI